jgi:hypothetical protein
MPCEHFPSPYIGYNYENDTYYCVLCDKEFPVENNDNISEASNETEDKNR